MTSGTFALSSGFEANCADAFLSTSVAADTCIVDGVFSYKLQLKQGKTSTLHTWHYLTK